MFAEPYRESKHYKPASGVQASCGDCHVSEGVIREMAIMGKQEG